MSNFIAAPAFNTIPVEFNCRTSNDLNNWFTQQGAAVGSPSWLLAYADDGVIWGKVVGKELITAADVFNLNYPGAFPVLNMEKLQKASLFGEKAEIRVFRKNDSWIALRIEDNPAAEESDSYDRSYILWGNKVKVRKDGWAWVEDGQLGIHQALPLEIDEGISYRIARIDVRYYITYEKDHGQASVAVKRLCKLYTVKEG